METKANNNEPEQRKNRELLEKFIVLEIENENFIIPLEYVSEIVRVLELTEAPHQPEWVKGIMNLRDSVISLVDTRKRLGIKSQLEESIVQIENAKTTHKNWITALEDTILNDAPFTKQLNPALCDYAKWSNALLENKEANDKIKRKLSEVIPLHDAIHYDGESALNFNADGNHNKAVEILEQIKMLHFAKMLECFNELTTDFQNLQPKDIAVIIEYDGSHFAMLADDITKMKTFQHESRQKGSLTDSQFILGIYDDEDGLYQELDLKGILRGKHSDSEDLVDLST